MTHLMEWLLDLEHVRMDGGAPVAVRFLSAWPGWLLVGCVSIAALWVLIIYRQELGSVWRRTLVGGLRLSQMALLFALLMGPSLVLQRNRVERSVVALLLDASASMSFVDRHDASATATPRVEQIRSSLLRDDGAVLRRLTKSHDVVGWTFSGGLERGVVAEREQDVSQLSKLYAEVESDGGRTDVGGAVEQLLERSAGRRLASVVVLTDGRSTEGGDLGGAIDAATRQQVPVHCVRVGSAAVPPDVAVSSVRAPHRVVLRDFLTVEALVRFGAVEPGRSLEVRLVDESSGALLASKHLEAGPDETRVELHIQPDRTGSHRLRVEVDALAGELSYDNNSERVDVEVIDDHLRVLYVDGYPRYEYRYLKNALMREESLDVSVLLLEADEEFVQEGTTPIRRFPQSPEELNRFDVILFGDVDPRGSWLSSGQMSMLLDAVANNAQGFALIAGERLAPVRFAQTPLSRLLPVRIDPRGEWPPDGSTEFRATLTPEGAASSILRFVADRERNQRLITGLPELYWIMPTLGVKPGATVLLEHPTRRTTGDGRRVPLLVTGRYGRGKVVFQATDETWRWRRHTGEFLHDAYWVQLVRFMADPGRNHPQVRFEIRSDAKVYAYGDPVRLRVEVFDERLAGELDERVGLQLEKVVGAPSGSAAPEGGVQVDVLSNVPALRIGAAARVFEAVVVPESSGSFRVTAPELAAGSLRQSVQTRPVLFQVRGPDLEARQPSADHAALARLATATGGKVVEAQELPVLLESIPDRSVRIPDDVVEPLWDTKLALALFVGLISAEWILRKLFGMV